METKKDINYKIDWKERATPVSSINPMPDFDRILDDRKHYFNMLRRLIVEIDKCETNEQIKSVFKKYNVYFVDMDEFERVNIDEPETKT